MPFVGMCPAVMEKNDRGVHPVLNEHIQTVRSERGILCPRISYSHEERIVHHDSQFHIWNGNPKLQGYLDVVKSNASNVQLTKPCHFKQMTASFFEKATGTPGLCFYAKALVKLDKANINDTISFTYGNRHYEVFIREIVPVGLDWFAVAFVEVSSPPEKPIVINEHTIVDMKRVVRVGTDAFSMKDIVRMVRGDSEKTDKLKEILTDASIDNAEKLKRASALV
jgi:hypothetical protein